MGGRGRRVGLGDRGGQSGAGPEIKSPLWRVLIDFGECSARFGGGVGRGGEGGGGVSILGEVVERAGAADGKQPVSAGCFAILCSWGASSRAELPLSGVSYCGSWRGGSGA